MTDTLFAIDELEVDALEPRYELAPSIGPSTCFIINTGIVTVAETVAKDEIQKLTYSTCYPG